MAVRAAYSRRLHSPGGFRRRRAHQHGGREGPAGDEPRIREPGEVRHGFTAVDAGKFSGTRVPPSFGTRPPLSRGPAPRAGAALCNARGVTSHARWAARPCCRLDPRGRGVKSCSRSVYADVSFEDARRCLPGDSRESVPARSTRLRRGERRLEAPAAAPPPRDGPHVSTPAP